jgi:hypothetical protein
MKCSACKFWVKSQMHGNHCVCTGVKPCERDRREKVEDHYKKRNRRHRKYNNNDDELNEFH